MYDIEPIFIIFPIICLFFAVLERKSRSLCVLLVTLAFVLVYSFSLNGSDILSYRMLYEAIAKDDFASVHGEAGFKLLMLISNALKIEYVVFRVILLICVSAVLFYAIRKTSPNFSLSVFFLTTMFVIYTISTYRQYIVFAFTLYWLYKFSLGKKIQAVIGTGLLAFFHVSAVLVFGMLVLFVILDKFPFKWCKSLNKTKIFLWIVGALVLRFAFVFAMRIDAFSRLMSVLTNGYSDSDVSLISVGLLARITFLAGISFLVQLYKPQGTLATLLFWFYFFGIIMYIIIPFNTFAGRLLNNFHILSIVLVPLMCRRGDKKIVGVAKARGVALQTKATVVILIAVAIVILINQLLKQDGYTPYLNILLGDKLP